MNKTPIQELIDWIFDCENSIFAFSATEIELKMLSQFKTKLKSELEKEKQFAFDCFEAGESYCSYHCGPNLEESPDFEQFYSQYDEPHIKTKDIVESSLDRQVNEYLFKDAEQHKK